MANFLIMANGGAASQERDQTSTTKKHNLGTLAFDEGGNEYRYLKGVASTVAGDWVTYDPTTFETTRATKTSIDLRHPVAVAQSANVADQYGWYCTYGYTEATVLADCDKNVRLYSSGTAGALDDGSTSQTEVTGAWAYDSADSASADVLTVFVNRPMAI